MYPLRDSIALGADLVSGCLRVLPRLSACLPLLLVLSGVLLPACGREHSQLHGAYALTATEIIQDDCGLLESPEALWDAEFESFGDVVRMDFDLLDLKLVGSYLDAVERFTVDGSVANATTSVGSGDECLLDRVSVHLEAVTLDEASFEGTIRVRYEAQSPDTCICQLLAKYGAVHK